MLAEQLTRINNMRASRIEKNEKAVVSSIGKLRYHASKQLMGLSSLQQHLYKQISENDNNWDAGAVVADVISLIKLCNEIFEKIDLLEHHYNFNQFRHHINSKE